MRQRLATLFIASVGFALVVGANQSADAGGHSVKTKTTSLVPDADGSVSCEVSASGREPLGIVATIVTEDGTDVTEYGTSYRASPGVILDAYYAEESVGSFADDARYCRVVVTGALRRDVEVTFTAYAASGAITATVQAH